MPHTTSEIVNNLKESLYNVSQNLMSLASETDFEKVLKVNNEVSDVLASLKELDTSITSLTSDQVTAKLTEATNLVNDVQLKLDSGFFKGDKGDKGDPGDFLAQDYNNLNNKPIDETKNNMNFFHYTFNDSFIGFEFLHLKTNIPKSNKMLRFKFSGYAHDSSRNVDSYLVGYTSSYVDFFHNSKIINNDFSLLVDTYYSTDGCLVIVCNNMVRFLSFMCSLSSPNIDYAIDVSTLRVTEYLFTSDSQAQLFKGL